MSFKLKSIDSIEKVNYQGTVFDLTIEEDHSYTINNIAVHNSACLTRIKTGMGVPQLTAIKDCSRSSKPIIADGGIRTPGDVCKAIAAGATMVMLGSMLAGTNETPGEIKEIVEWHISKTDYYTSSNNNDFIPKPQLDKKVTKVKTFRGMASKEANEDQFGQMADWKTAEGISTSVECKGPVANVIRDIMGGLRSSMTYSGSFSLEEFRRRVEFIEITPNGVIESRAHINE